MKITTSSTESGTSKGPADWFTGDVYIDAVASASAPGRVVANLVHFMPGARTAWHRHPLGQSLFVTEGIGLVQRRGPMPSVTNRLCPSGWRCHADPADGPPRAQRGAPRRPLGRARH
jgi:hypothetical protein